MRNKRRVVLMVLGAVLLVALGLVGYNAAHQAIIRKRDERSQIVHELDIPRRSTESPTNTKSGSIYFVGNATVIIRYAGFTLLTDPNFLHKGDHVHLGYGLQAKRVTNPTIELEDLPPIDLVILSHMHDDHFDKLVQQKLDKAIPIITTGHAAKALKHMGFKHPYSLDTWQSAVIRKDGQQLRVTAMPGQHGPGIVSGVLPPVNGAMLTFETSGKAPFYRIYITGDTLIHDELARIPEQFPDIDLALLHLGGTRVLGMFVTMDARQGVRMLELVIPKEAIPIHYNDYDRFESPLTDFQKAVEKASLSHKMRYLKHGETYAFTPPANRQAGE